MPAGGAPRYDVFLSHSSKDKPWVSQFARALSGLGLNVFYDAVEIPAGGDFRARIADALCGTHTKLILFLTHNSIASDWVYWEFTLAANPDPGNRLGRVVFVYLEDVVGQLPNEMRYPASDVRLFDAAARPEAWKRLLKAVGHPDCGLPAPTDAELARSSPPQPLPPAPIAKRFIVHHPPGQAQTFVGRAVELEQLDAALVGPPSRSGYRMNATGSPNAPVVAVVGIGGQGKSTLVWQWLARRQDQLPHEVVFYSTAYRGGFNFAQFLDSALTDLGGGRYDPRVVVRTEDRVDLLMSFVRERPTLVIIDGIERWLRGWQGAADPMAMAHHDDLRAADSSGPESDAKAPLDLFLQAAAGLSNGSQLLLTTRALPWALEGCRVARISTEPASARERKMEGLDDEAAVALLRSCRVNGDAAELKAAAREYGNHALALTVLGNNVAALYGGDIRRRPNVEGLVELEDKISRLLDDLERHRPADVPILRVASLCFDEAPLPAIAAALGETDADAGQECPARPPISDSDMRLRMADLDCWGVVDFDGAGDGAVRLHPLIHRHFRNSFSPRPPDSFSPRPRGDQGGALPSGRATAQSGPCQMADAPTIHRRLSTYFGAKPIPKEASRLDEVRPRTLAVEHALAAGDLDRCFDLLFGKMNEWFKLADWFNAWGHFEFAISLERRLADAAAGETHAAFLNSIGLSEWLMGRLGDALADYDAAISIYRELVEAERPKRSSPTVMEGRRDLRNELAGSLQNRAIAHDLRGDPDSALADFDAAITILRELVEAEGRRDLRNALAMSLQNRAGTHRLRGDLDSALADYNAAIAIYRELVEGEGRRDLRNKLAMSLQNRANAHQQRGDLDSALADYNAAIAICRELVEAEGRRDLRNDLAMSLQNRAIAHQQRGDLPAALADYDAAIAIRRELVEGEGRRDLRNDLAASLLNRAMAKARRDPKEALSDAEPGLNLWRELLAEGQRQCRALFVKNLAIAAQDFDVPAGRPEAGCRRVGEGLDILEKALGERDGWNEVLAMEAAHFFDWTGAVIKKLRRAGLDAVRYDRVRKRVAEKSRGAGAA
jgi:tetratricopeptide (TPR) repeat protein